MKLNLMGYFTNRCWILSNINLNLNLSIRVFTFFCYTFTECYEDNRFEADDLWVLGVLWISRFSLVRPPVFRPVQLATRNFFGTGLQWLKMNQEAGVRGHANRLFAVVHDFFSFLWNNTAKFSLEMRNADTKTRCFCDIWHWLEWTEKLVSESMQIGSLLLCILPWLWCIKGNSALRFEINDKFFSIRCSWLTEHFPGYTARPMVSLRS